MLAYRHAFHAGNAADVLKHTVLLDVLARMAFGCNVGAYFSGISTGSLHGWVWFASAFAGSTLGVRLRSALGIGSRR